MAWAKPNDPPPSTFRQLLPLLVVLAVLAGLGWIGYQVYLGVTKIQGNVAERMGNKHVVLTKGGLRVGVKHVEQEEYVDATQSWVVKAWNLSGKEKEEVEQMSRLQKQR